MPCAFLGRQYSIGKGDPDTLTGPQPAHELLQQGSIPMPEPGMDRAALRPAGQTERALGKEAGLWLGKVKALQVSHGFFFFPPSLCLPPLLQSVAPELSAMLFQFRGSCNRKDQLLENPWKALGESHGRKVISRQSYYHYAAN